MNIKKLLISLLLANVLALIWSFYSFSIIASDKMFDTLEMIQVTPSAVQLSIEKIDDYTVEEKQENVLEIVHLYRKLYDYIDWNRRFTIETVDTVFQFTYILFALSFFNLIATFILVKRDK